uniref:Uncharacterized protein n=1 Tax=Arundo donax TaxID=35708 RepID=A0A0A9AVF8_ARUDO
MDLLLSLTQEHQYNFTLVPAAPPYSSPVNSSHRQLPALPNRQAEPASFPSPSPTRAHTCAEEPRHVGWILPFHAWIRCLRPWAPP